MVGLEREEGGLRDVRDLSRLREGEEARREAREWCEGAGGVGGLVRIGDRGGDGTRDGEQERGGTFGGLFQFGCFCHAGWRCE